jgi:hypothetical protein
VWELSRRKEVVVSGREPMTPFLGLLLVVLLDVFDFSEG